MLLIHLVPVVINNFVTCGTLSALFKTKPKKQPIAKQPIMFALKVPIIGVDKCFVDKMVKPYLKIAPSPPPINTEIIFNSISNLFNALAHFIGLLYKHSAIDFYKLINAFCVDYAHFF